MSQSLVFPLVPPYVIEHHDGMLHAMLPSPAYMAAVMYETPCVPQSLPDEMHQSGHKKG